MCLSMYLENKSSVFDNDFLGPGHIGSLVSEDGIVPKPTPQYFDCAFKYIVYCSLAPFLIFYCSFIYLLYIC